MEKVLYVKDLSDWDVAAKELLDYCKSKLIFAIYGEMGAGKTTFIQSICKVLGVKNKVVSPTFAIVNEYAGERPVYHFDLYRLKNADELMNIGLLDYLNSGNYCLIEWPEMAEQVLPDETVKVFIDNPKGVERKIKITGA